MFSIAALMLFAAVTVHAQAAMVACKDGTSSKGGRGACSGHGGVVSAKAAAKADEKNESKAEKKAEAKAEKRADAKVEEKHESKAEKRAERKAAKKDEKTESKAEKRAEAKAEMKEGAATATCNDGTKSYAKNHTGTCSGHGGVKEWLDGTKKP
ncbi:MAG TPA: DUF3761 domain-containing protein [Gemmatimonadaceae bacterium]